MRRITADYVFSLSQPPIANGVVAVSDSGRIESVYASGEGEAPTESYKGVLCPGFINTHCHLELSHLKGKIAEGTGLPGFIRDLNPLREASAEEVEQAQGLAEKEMINQGIRAVGDISNGASTFARKAKGTLIYHTFIELFGLNPSQAENIYSRGQELQDRYLDAFAESAVEARVSIVPHAPYSLSLPLLEFIGKSPEGAPLSLHNQETASETLFFENGSGALADVFRGFGIDLSLWNAPSLRSLEATVQHLPVSRRLLLVHNTFSTETDIDWANQYSTQISWCLCPNANMYIEGCLPDVPMLQAKGAHLTVGTDSLASNHGLSILEELKTLSAAFPDISLEELLTWGCLNGAEFLEISEQLGSLENGKTPGINLITGVDSSSLCLTRESTVQVLV